MLSQPAFLSPHSAPLLGIIAITPSLLAFAFFVECLSLPLSLPPHYHHGAPLHCSPTPLPIIHSLSLILCIHHFCHCSLPISSANHGLCPSSHQLHFLVHCSFWSHLFASVYASATAPLVSACLTNARPCLAPFMLQCKGPSIDSFHEQPPSLILLNLLTTLSCAYPHAVPPKSPMPPIAGTTPAILLYPCHGTHAKGPSMDSFCESSPSPISLTHLPP